MPGKVQSLLDISRNINRVILCRVNLPTGEGDMSDSNSSEELESVIESEADHHIDFVSLGSN